MEKEKYGELATIVGRYYAMDRDKRWERVKIAVDGLVRGEGEKAEDAIKAIEGRYKKGETDEFLKPIILSDEGRIKGKSIIIIMILHGTVSREAHMLNFLDGDTLFFFNYRSDRMREIVTIFGIEDKPIEIEVPKDLVGLFLFSKSPLYKN